MKATSETFRYWVSILLFAILAILGIAGSALIAIECWTTGFSLLSGIVLAFLFGLGLLSTGLCCDMLHSKAKSKNLLLVLVWVGGFLLLVSGFAVFLYRIYEDTR